MLPTIAIRGTGYETRPVSLLHVFVLNTLLQEILASCLFSDFETQIFSDTIF